MQAVDDALNAGIDRFSFDDRERVKKAKKDLRITDAMAKEILDKQARYSWQGLIAAMS